MYRLTETNRQLGHDKIAICMRYITGHDATNEEVSWLKKGRTHVPRLLPTTRISHVKVSCEIAAQIDAFTVILHEGKLIREFPGSPHQK
jgi:hypothetical protein